MCWAATDLNFNQTILPNNKHIATIKKQAGQEETTMLNEAYSNIKLFTCNSHPELAEEIARHMGVQLGKATVTKFSDGEISVSIWESVRGRDCII